MDESSIGACGFFDVIEHIEDDLAMLKTTYQLMKPGGKIYITVPAYSFLWSQEDIDAGHYRRYSIPSARRLLQQVGFDVVYSSYLFSFLPLPIFLLRTVPHLSGSGNKPANHRQDHQSSKSRAIVERLMSWELQRVKRQNHCFPEAAVLLLPKRKGKCRICRLALRKPKCATQQVLPCPLPPNLFSAPDHGVSGWHYAFRYHTPILCLMQILRYNTADCCYMCF